MKQYILYSFRSLFKFRATIALQLAGFLVGLGAFIPVALVLHYHVGFDSYHKQGENIVRLSTGISLPTSSSVYAATSKTLAPLLNEQLPAVDKTTRCRFMPANILVDGKTMGEEAPLFADAAFLKIFTAEPVLGDLAQAMANPNGLVITETASKRFFGDESPIGKVMSVETPAGDFSLVVNAVIRDYPANVSLRFQLLANFSLIEHAMRNEAGALVPGLFTFALLQPEADNNEVSRQLKDLVSAHFPEGLKTVISILPVPYHEIHYVTDHQFDAGQKGSKINNTAIAALAFFLLLISIVNYTNLSTALFIRRSKELAIRRIVGEGVWQQRIQLLTEAGATMLLCMALLAVLSWYLIPHVETLTNLTLQSGWATDWRFYVLCFACGIVIAMIASAYPVWNSFRTSAALLTQKPAPNIGGVGLRYMLLTIQLAVAVGFAVVALGMEQQLHYVRSKDLGFDRQAVLTLGLGTGINDKAAVIKQQLEQLPFVKAATISLTPISGDHIRAQFGLINDTTGATHMMNANYVDHDFLQVYGVRLLAGRSFDKAFASDVQRSYILNERAIALLGFSSPADALNQPFGKQAGDSLQQGSIIGVIDDYHFLPLYRELEPMVWQIEPSAPRNLLSLRVEGNDSEFQLQELTKAMEALGIVQPFEFASLNDTLDRAYADDSRLALFIKVATLVIVFIAMLGVFSLAAFILETRRRELGIRRLLGAEVFQLVWLFCRAFAGCLIGGLLVGGAASWHFLGVWLAAFTYHPQPGFWYLPFTGLVLAALMLFTVLSKVAKAASTNPVEVLREK